MADKVKDLNTAPEAMNSQNVSVGKGSKAVGTIYCAPKGTTLPTDASTAIASPFVNMGLISEDGITEAVEIDSEDFNDMNGDNCLNSITSNKLNFTFKLIETKADVLKEIFGSDNVTVTAATSTTGQKIAVLDKAQDPIDRVWVIDIVLTGSRKERIVLPLGKISEFGETQYASSEVIGNEITINCTKDSSGNRRYIYIDDPAAS